MSVASKPVRPFGDFLRVLIAPAIWFAHFSFLYGAEALVCIEPSADSGTTMGWMVFLGTAVALIGLMLLGAGLLRSATTASPRSNHDNTWLRRVSLLLTLLSTLAVIWTTLPTAVLPACGLPTVLR